MPGAFPPAPVGGCALLDPFVQRLEHGANLTAGDRAALSDLTRYRRAIDGRRSIVEEGADASRVRIILDGWACRWKGLPNGQRQITELLLPGDICHAYSGMLLRSDHSIATLSTSVIAEVDQAELATLLEQRPIARQALRWSSLQTDSILRTALVNNGLRQAEQRIAHLICEILARLQSVGLAQNGTFSWPLTQIDVGEIASMSSVHVNRTFRKLRGDDLLTLQKRQMSIQDVARLAAFCDFRSDYLHFKAELGAFDQ